MGLGYVYMDLPYGNKKERMEPEGLCVGNPNKAVTAYGCMELTKSPWPSKVSIFIATLKSDSQSN